jgi:hypothetical protein
VKNLPSLSPIEPTGRLIGQVAAVVAAGFVPAARRAATADFLHDGGDAAFDLDAVERLGQFGGRSLDGIHLRFDRLDARCEFGILFGNALAGQRLFEILVLLFQRLDACRQALHFGQHRRHVIGGSGHGAACRQGGGENLPAHDQYPPFLPTPA